MTEREAEMLCAMLNAGGVYPVTPINTIVQLAQFNGYQP
jgi:hypothetical protein